MTDISVRLRRFAAYTTTLTMAAFGFTGMVSAQTITNTGPGSSNNITTNMTENCKVTNANNIHATSSNTQTATTGNANVSGNTTALPWSGWSNLDPEAAQAAGVSYASWWGNVLDWVSARAAGQGWTDLANQTGWVAGTTQWSQWDPIAWQQQGQSFNDWFSGLQAYMNTNSASWLLAWPATAEGAMAGSDGATSGNATNVNNASFTVNIINRAPVDSCGNSVIPIAPPGTPFSGGSGGGMVSPATHTAFGGSGGGSGGGGSYGGFFSAPRSAFVAPAIVTPPAPAVVVPPTPPQPPTPPTPPANSITNTGPGSNNNITSNDTNNTQVANNNTVNTIDLNQQAASSGSANVSNNDSAGGAGSGAASNENNASGDMGVTS